MRIVEDDVNLLLSRAEGYGVEPSLGLLRVADRARARRAGVSTLGLGVMIGVQCLESALPEALFQRRMVGVVWSCRLTALKDAPFRQHQNQFGAKHTSGGPSTGLGDTA